MCNGIAPLFGVSLFIHFDAVISLFFLHSITFIIRTLTKTNHHQIVYVVHRKSSSILLSKWKIFENLLFPKQSSLLNAKI